MSLSSYLASKYLTADPPSSKTSKKRKRKTAPESVGLIIADDDDSGWTNPSQAHDDEDGPTISSTGSAEFRKTKKNAWKVVGTPVPSSSSLDADSAAADRIIATAAAENAAQGDHDDAPVVEGEDDSVVKMGDGTHAGLQSAAAVSEQMARRAREEREAWAAEEKRLMREGKSVGGGETVYRDATGRRIDISMRRAELRREEEEKAKKEREKKEEQKGEVQREAARERKELLEEARFMPLARTVDDEDMNKELKDRDRWNDPAAQFLSEGTKSSGGGGASRKKGGKKTFGGSAPPNRYGIRPGWRWDGVDRGNGWEGERFKAINRKTRNKELDFAWQMDT